MINPPQQMWRISHKLHFYSASAAELIQRLLLNPIIHAIIKTKQKSAGKAQEMKQF
jgi:hypothetical protein